MHCEWCAYHCGYQNRDLTATLSLVAAQAWAPTASRTARTTSSVGSGSQKIFSTPTRRSCRTWRTIRAQRLRAGRIIVRVRLQCSSPPPEILLTRLKWLSCEKESRFKRLTPTRLHWMQSAECSSHVARFCGGSGAIYKAAVGCCCSGASTLPACRGDRRDVLQERAVPDYHGHRLRPPTAQGVLPNRRDCFLLRQADRAVLISDLGAAQTASKSWMFLSVSLACTIALMMHATTSHQDSAIGMYPVGFVGPACMVSWWGCSAMMECASQGVCCTCAGTH